MPFWDCQVLVLPLAGHSLLQRGCTQAPDVFEQVQLYTHCLAARVFLALNT